MAKSVDTRPLIGDNDIDRKRQVTDKANYVSQRMISDKKKSEQDEVQQVSLNEPKGKPIIFNLKTNAK